MADGSGTRTRIDDPRGRLQAVIDAAHLPIDPPCRALLTTLVDVAVARLAAGTVANSAAFAGPSPIDGAVVALQRLIDDMTQQSRILRFDAIHEPNVVSALTRLCPLWPFC